MQEFFNDPLGVGMLIFALFLNLGASWLRWEKKRASKMQG